MKASIIVITYNEEKNIQQCLNSLFAQDYRDYEILVVDASQDKTAEIVKKNKKVKFIPSAKGFGIQRNIGIKHAKGTYIAFTDADCIAPPDWLHKGITLLEKDNVAGVGGNAYPPENSPSIGKAIACLGYPAGGALGLHPAKDPISTCNAFFLKKALEDVQGFNETMIYGGEDTDICRRLTKKGYKTLIDPSLFVYHKTRNFPTFLKWSARRGKAKYHLQKNPLHILMPLSIFIYPFTSKYRNVFKKRKHLHLDFFTVFIVIPTLFFLRQFYMSKGWINAALHQTRQ